MNEFLILSLGVMLGLTVQTTVGFAATLVAMPILLMVLDIQTAIAMLAPLLFLFSMVLLPQNWKYVDKKLVKEVGVWTVIGVIIGVTLLQIGNPQILKRLLGVFTVLYVAHSIFVKQEIKMMKKAGPWLAFLGGIFSGLFSSGAAFFVIYVTNHQRLRKRVRATLIGIFTITNTIRLPIMVGNGLLTYDIFFKSLTMLPAFVMGILLGTQVFKALDQKLFIRFVLTLLFVSGLLLVVR